MFERLSVPFLSAYFGARLEVHVFATEAEQGERYDAADLGFVVFGQCATGCNWPNKQFEVSAAMWWGRILHLTGPITSVLLIAFSYRRPDGNWHDTTKFATTNLVFDRDRIVALVDLDAADIPVELIEMMRTLEDADVL